MKKIVVPAVKCLWAVITAVLICLSACIASQAANVIKGENFPGGDLICGPGTGANPCGPEDELVGIFRNVGKFEIKAGTTVNVGGNTPLVIYASTITIAGELNGVGRGDHGGLPGDAGYAGKPGFGPGFGGGGVAEAGGGSGGYGGDGGDGKFSGAGFGIGGNLYGSTIAANVPVSTGDALMGSGGGGGGGGVDTNGGGGGAGGAGIYLEASYIQITGTITVNGSIGSHALGSGAAPNPAAGGGGAGGTILIRSPGTLDISGLLSAKGGDGGSGFSINAQPAYPGGGGGGGRVKILRRPGVFSFQISTVIGRGGYDFGGLTGYAQDGSTGTVGFGIIASSPTGFSISEVFITSVAYSWSNKLDPEWGGPLGDLTARRFKLYTATVPLTAVPLSMFYSGVFISTDLTNKTITGLTPNVTVYSCLAAFTDWGESLPSTMISASPGVSDMTSPTKPGRPHPPKLYSYDGAVTFSWSAAQTPAGILGYYYQLGTFPGASDFTNGEVFVGNVLSTTTTGLVNKKTYYARVRARSNGGVYGEYSDSSPGVTVFIPGQEPSSPFVEPYNWPNPFDPYAQGTEIGFYISAPAKVTIRIFTLEGDLVHEETWHEVSAGDHVRTWSGRNDNGKIVAPGGYICLLIKSYPHKAERQKFKIAVLY